MRAAAVAMPIVFLCTATAHAEVRLRAELAPATIGNFSVGTDGHYDGGGIAFGARVGVHWAPVRFFSLGVDGGAIVPYDGYSYLWAIQAAARGALPVSEEWELGLTARFGPGFGHVKEGLTYVQTSKTPYPPGPAVAYSGWQAGIAFDATWWARRNVGWSFALEAWTASEKTTAGGDVYFGYVAKRLAPYALAPSLSVLIVL